MKIEKHTFRKEQRKRGRREKNIAQLGRGLNLGPPVPQLGDFTIISGGEGIIKRKEGRVDGWRKKCAQSAPAGTGGSTPVPYAC